MLLSVRITPDAQLSGCTCNFCWLPDLSRSASAEYLLKIVTLAPPRSGVQTEHARAAGGLPSLPHGSQKDTIRHDLQPVGVESIFCMPYAWYQQTSRLCCVCKVQQRHTDYVWTTPPNTAHLHNCLFWS